MELYRKDLHSESDFIASQTRSFQLRRGIILRSVAEDGTPVSTEMRDSKGLPFMDTYKKFPYLWVKSVVCLHMRVRARSTITHAHSSTESPSLLANPWDTTAINSKWPTM